MTRLVVDVAQLEELVTEMASFEARVGTGFDVLAGRLRGLHAGWRGAAAAEQLSAQQQLTDAAEQMRTALLGLRAAADTAAANYRACSAANCRMWAR